jgi:hypothetical protein
MHEEDGPHEASSVKEQTPMNNINNDSMLMHGRSVKSMEDPPEVCVHIRSESSRPPLEASEGPSIIPNAEASIASSTAVLSSHADRGLARKPESLKGVKKSVEEATASQEKRESKLQVDSSRSRRRKKAMCSASLAIKLTVFVGFLVTVATGIMALIFW